MTTFMNIDAAARRVEIGSTWYRKSVQRSAINTECKMLLLAYAFEELDCIAVEFRTHFLNYQSRAAIERLGAHADGILTSHMIMANGTIRDTAVYSIIRSEWPTIKTHLSNKLGDWRDKKTSLAQANKVVFFKQERVITPSLGIILAYCCKTRSHHSPPIC